MQLRLELGKQERLLERAIGECSLLATSGIGALPFVAKPGNLHFGRTFAVPGRCWKADVLPNPAFHTSSRLKVTAGSRGSPPRQPLIVRMWPSALSEVSAAKAQRMPGPWTAVAMNCNSRRSHPSVERRRRRLLVVVRTERLLLHGVEAVRESLEELRVLCGKGVSKLRDLHLALRKWRYWNRRQCLILIGPALRLQKDRSVPNR